MEWVCAILIPGKLVKVSFAFVKSTGKPDGDQVPRYVQIMMVVPYNLTAIFTRKAFSYNDNNKRLCIARVLCRVFAFIFDFAGFHKNSLQLSQRARKICFRACKCNLVGQAWDKFLARATLNGYFEHQTWCTSRVRCRN